MPADDRHNFVLRATGRIPLLLVDGAPSSAPSEGASDFLELAVEPPASRASTRSPFEAKTIIANQLTTASIDDYAAIYLADVPRLDPRSIAQLNKYVEYGGSELELFLSPGRYQILTPNGKVLPVPAANGSGPSMFGSTAHTGFYRLIEGEQTMEEMKRAPLVAAINVPREESSLERIDRHTIRRLLPGYSMEFTRPRSGEEQQFGRSPGAKSAKSSFPLAMLAILCLLGEVLLGWRIGRPSQDKPEEQQKQNLRNS